MLWSEKCNISIILKNFTILFLFRSRAGTSLAASDVRRWSIASLPSSSGCGTPESISAFSSDYSSQEHLTEMLNDLNVVPRFDSTDVYPLTYEPPLSYGRQRSCSLTYV